MKKLILATLTFGLGAALAPFAHAQFGSGVVFDPTQAGHAVTQIRNEEKSIANEVHQLEQGQQIFTNTVKIATTALQAYNPPDDARAQDALCAVSVSNFRLADAAADLEYLWQLDGVAELREYGKRRRSRLSASKRAEHCQSHPRLQRGQCRRAAADCRARSHD